jgi:DNA-binding IclR family transcriptional regulator
MRYKELPEEYAIVLQQINEDGGDNIDDLVDTVRVDKSRLAHIVSALHHRGLVTVENLGYEPWLTVSAKGRRLIHYLWPESGMHYQY